MVVNSLLKTSFPLLHLIFLTYDCCQPFLLDGFKCDLRIYVLVTSCKPLRILVFKDGLVIIHTLQIALRLDSKSVCTH